MRISDFVPELIRRCRKEDLLFPLLDFLVGSVDNISAMEFKRYDSSSYQERLGMPLHGAKRIRLLKIRLTAF